MLPVVLSILLLQATYTDLYQEGRRLLDEGNIKEAEILLANSASINPSYVPPLKALAEVYVKNKRFPEAIDKYVQIIEINPKDITARGHLAELYSWVGNYDKSIVTYKDALEIDTQNIGLKTGLAKVLRWSQRYDEAEVLYRDVLQGDPNNYEALKGLVKTYAMAGDLTSALSILDKAISLYPDDGELYKEKGTILAWQKDFKEAIEMLKRSVAISPMYAEAYRTMGDVYSWMKSYQMSIEAYKKAATIEPANIENHILLARVYRTTEDDRLAEEAIKTALRIDPSDPQALEILQEIRGGKEPRIVETMGEAVHGMAFIFTLTMVFFSYRSRRRMLKRRHRLYFHFTNIILPALIMITLASYIGKNTLTQWINADIIEDTAETILFFGLGTSFFALLWTEKRSKEYMGMTVLAIGAHPDDIEIGCGGFIMKAKESGAKAYGLTFTKGEKGTGRNGKRAEELVRAFRFLELDGFWIMDFKDTELKESVLKIKDIIEEKIRETGAALVLAHTDIDIHSDHRAIAEATREAGRNISILSYEDVSTPREFIPNYYADITDYMEDKIKLISFHKTQMDKTYMDPEAIRGRAAHRGIQSNVPYAEAFRAYRLLR